MRSSQSGGRSGGLSETHREEYEPVQEPDENQRQIHLKIVNLCGDAKPSEGGGRGLLTRRGRRSSLGPQTTKISDRAKQRTMTPTNLVSVIPLQERISGTISGLLNAERVKKCGFSTLLTEAPRHSPDSSANTEVNGPPHQRSLEKLQFDLSREGDDETAQTGPRLTYFSYERGSGDGNISDQRNNSLYFFKKIGIELTLKEKEVK